MRKRTNPRHALASLLYLSAALTCAHAAPAAETVPLVTPILGAAYELRAADEKYEARVPVTLRRDVQPSQVMLTKLYVEFNGRQDNQLYAAFDAAWETPAPGHAPTIIITAYLKKAKEPGAYTLGLRASAGSGPPQPLTFKLNRPAAKLRTLGTLVVQQVQPLLSATWEVYPEFSLREIGKHSFLADAAVTQVEATAEREQPVRASLQFDKPAAALSPDQRMPVTYKTSGDFPLGSTKGTIEVNSPQLSEPVTFNFEVRARRGRGIIWLILLLGFLAGYLVRTRMQQQLALNEARIGALEVKGQIVAQRDEARDEVFVNKVDALLQTLDAALAKATSSLFTAAARTRELNGATATAKTEFEGAQTEMKTRRDAAREAYKALAHLIETPWSLPADVRAGQTQARERLPRAHAFLDEDNVTAADKEMGAIRRDFAASLSQPVAAWRGDSLLLLDTLANESSTLRHILPGPLVEAVAVLRPVIAGAQLAPGDTSSAGLKSLLETLHKSLEGISELRLGFWVRSYVDEVVATLQQAGGRNDDALAKLRDTAKTAADLLSAAAEQPGTVLEGLQDFSAELDKALRAAVLTQVPPLAKDDEKAAVTKALDERRYLDAARGVLNIFRRIMAEEGTALGPVPESKAAEAADPTSSAWQLPGAPAAAPTAILLGTRSDARLPTGAAIASASRSLLGLRLLQTLFIGLVVTVLGYYMFADNFVGRGRELFAIFLWAFSLDISAEMLMQKIPELKTQTRQ